MVRPRSRFCSRLPVLAGLVAAGAGAFPVPASPQSGLEAICPEAGEARAECLLAVATVRAVQERVGTALWGGNPVPATASTVGMRIGSAPRASVGGSFSVVPATFPSLRDRSRAEEGRSIIPALALHGTVGLLPGWSPVPTVGGVLSLDAVTRLSLAPLPGAFQESVAMGIEGGVRLGLLRESFTMPGVSVTGMAGRSTGVTYGDPMGEAGDGFVQGSVTDLSATLAASRRFAPFRVSGGLTLDRYTTRATVGHRDELGGPVERQGRVTTNTRSWFAGAEWTTMIFHGSVELGWQDAARPQDLPADVRFRPSRWWGSVAARLSI